tara:strand:+ start:351 stop:704 length:354 start_codon:yes stop_codon:yes gene_type:complete
LKETDLGPSLQSNPSAELWRIAGSNAVPTTLEGTELSIVQSNNGLKIWRIAGSNSAPMPVLAINTRVLKKELSGRGSFDKLRPEEQTALKCFEPQARKSSSDLRHLLDLWSSYCING